MAEPDESIRDQPLCQPRLVRFLRQRPRLVDFGLREQALANLEHNMCERRKPDKVAEHASKQLQEAGEPVVRDTLREQLSQANERLFSRL